MSADESQFLLDAQIGFLLRRAYQRHVALFTDSMPPGLTPTQSSALIRLLQCGPISQNRLGRKIAVDASTIKGVVDRLAARGLVALQSDPEDKRRLLVCLTRDGERFVRSCLPKATAVADATLEPLTDEERSLVIKLLERIS